MKPITDICIFTRDLRIHDNECIRNALQMARRTNGAVKCIFVFRDDQISMTNQYRSDNSIAFMLESLKDLDNQLYEYGGSLSCFREKKGSSHETIMRIIRTIQLKRKDDDTTINVHMTRDYTPYADSRENTLRTSLKKINSILHLYDTHLLSPHSLNIKSNGKTEMYQVFSPFYKKVIKAGIPKPLPLGVSRVTCVKHGLLSKQTFKSQISIDVIHKTVPKTRLSEHRIVKGGRNEGLRVLRLSKKRIKPSYTSNRHHLYYDTSKLSAYHHYGCISVRETWVAFSNNIALRRQLIWRDYAYHMMYLWPSDWESIRQVGSVSSGIPWKKDIRYVNAWKNGKTGVPSVDAAMRQLKKEGYIHNRGRMIAANYLIKNLRIDWRIGEKHFAQWLTDYDRSVNFMNWIQIAAVLPTDQPTRTMNPYIQTKKHDNELFYIRKYIPELINTDDSHVFSQERDYPIRNKEDKIVYPKPIISYSKSREQYITWAKKYLLGYHPKK